jgi:hypothetical protein
MQGAGLRDGHARRRCCLIHRWYHRGLDDYLILPGRGMAFFSLCSTMGIYLTAGIVSGYAVLDLEPISVFTVIVIKSTYCVKYRCLIHWFIQPAKPISAWALVKTLRDLPPFRGKPRNQYFTGNHTDLCDILPTAKSLRSLSWYSARSPELTVCLPASSVLFDKPEPGHH